MAKKDDKGRWIDAAGNHVPVKYIDPVRKKRDAMVEKLFRQALQAQERLRKFKELADRDLAAYLDWLLKTKGEKALSEKGNYELKTFAGDKQICIDINEPIEFDERLQLAKQKIDRCLERWSEGADDKLKTIIFKAFKVNKKGKVDSRSILGLGTLKFDDKEWEEAMDLIRESITITCTRRYIRFQIRETPDSGWKTIRLDLAGV